MSGNKYKQSYGLVNTVAQTGTPMLVVAQQGLCSGRCLPFEGIRLRLVPSCSLSRAEIVTRSFDVRQRIDAEQNRDA